jgi:hypothetical protein
LLELRGKGKDVLSLPLIRQVDKIPSSVGLRWILKKEKEKKALQDLQKSIKNNKSQIQGPLIINSKK